jgi:UDP-glucose 4,6-dehydratase
LYEATNSVSHREEFVEACTSLALFGSEYGIYNVTNSGYVTTKDVVECIKKNLGIVKDYTYWEDDEEFYSKGAATPRSNCVMDNVKLLSTGIDMRHCMDAIEMSLRAWKNER